MLKLKTSDGQRRKRYLYVAIDRCSRSVHLGDSGSTTGPHLRFQVMDHTSPLKAYGLPLAFDRMLLQGQITDSVNGTGEKLSEGTPVPIDYTHRTLLHGAMPLTLDVLSLNSPMLSWLHRR